jgi:hypothetical protein
MRSVLIALLAFAAGVLLVLALTGHSMRSPAAVSPARAPHTATASSSEPAVPSFADAEAGADNSADWPDAGPSPEQVLYAQPRMVREALAKFTPRVAGKPNLYLVAFAGDGGEDVFRNEAEYAAQLFAERFGATAHSLVLENNPATLAAHPLASWSNLETALDGLSRVMQPEQDILLLYVTSHGDEEHNLLVDMDPLPLDQIGAPDLAGILAKRHFKWKVVVVNACYSGGFVPSLRGPGTLVLAAARADRSSFGCGSDADVTYFGRAWLVDALNRTADFIEAFKQASGEVSRWEQQDRLTPSEPQIDVGSGIANQLALWRKGFVPGSPVTFKPVMPASASTAGALP